MGEYQPTLPTGEGEQHVIAAAQHIVKALGANKNLSDDLRKILLDLDAHLSTMNSNMQTKGRRFAEVEERLKHAERKIHRWESDQMMIWDAGQEEVTDYLEAVGELQALIKGFRGLSSNESGKQKELLCQAESTLETAMSRLEEEVVYILCQHQRQFEPKYISFRSYGEEVVYDESFVSVEDESADEASRSRRKECEECSIDLLDPQAIPFLTSIATAMFTSDYGQDFCETFISARKEAVDEYLAILEMRKQSIEDVLKMEWESMNSEMKKWTWSMKILFRVYLASEKRICNQIFRDLGSFNAFCFIEISRTSVSCLLNFGEAIAMGPHRPEKLFRLLDMYEILAELLLDIDSLFSEEAGSFVRIEFHELLDKLGDSVRAAFHEFKNAISSDPSIYPFRGGGIHPLNRYVMNFTRIFPVYSDTLNLLLKDQELDVENPVSESHSGQDISPCTFCLVGCHLRSITSTLESNLHEKSELYKDEALKHIFLMNNIHYMVQKVKGSELRLFLGDEWIRKHNAKFQQYATSYERATWSSVLSLLKDDGNPWSSYLSKTGLKERCKGFSTAFEEIYKSQTRWCIPDPQLREDLQISTSLKVIHAYRTFLGKNSVHIGDKHIKYTAETLENLLLDLFEGSPRTLRNSRKG